MTNIKPFLPKERQEMLTEEFRDEILLKIFGVATLAEVNTYQLTDKDWIKINEISDRYYRNWDWNYGKSPDFNFSRQKRYPIGSIEVHLNVSHGLIDDVKIFGDFFGLGEIKDVEEKLIGQRYDKSVLSDVVKTIDIKKYFGAIEAEDFLALYIDRMLVISQKQRVGQ